MANSDPEKEVAYYPFVYVGEKGSGPLYDGNAYVPVYVRGNLWHWSGRSFPTRLCAEIHRWLVYNPSAKKDAVVLHEPLYERGKTFNSISSADEHRFLFTDAIQALAFKRALSKFPEEGKIFKTFSVEEIGLAYQGSSTALAGTLHYALPEKITREAIELWFWCIDNLKGEIYAHQGITIFTNEEDLVLFKLKWCGKIKKKAAD